jgi:hypothetical protein
MTSGKGGLIGRLVGLNEERPAGMFLAGHFCGHPKPVDVSFGTGSVIGLPFMEIYGEIPA